MNEVEKKTVNVAGMKQIGVRLGIRQYIKELWRLRHFALAEARGQAFQKSRGTILGRIWILTEPFINASIYLVMFGLILKTDRGIDNFFGYLLVGSIIFSYTSISFGQAGTIIQSGTALLRSFTFPRATLVLSFILRNTINAIPTYAVLIGAIIVLPTHALPAVYWVALPLIFMLQIIFNSGLAFMIASLTARIPDLKFIWPLIARFWFFVSGIFFSVQRFISVPFVAAIMQANPAYIMLTIYRDLLLYHNFSSITNWIYFFTWSIILFASGFIMFWRNEEKYGVPNAR